MVELDIGPRPATLHPKEDIVGMVLQYMEVGPKIWTTCTCAMLDKLLKAMGEVDLNIGPDLLTPTIQVIIVDHLVFIVMVIT